MAEVVPVTINGEGPNTVGVPEAVTVSSDFTVSLENQGTDAHVHLRLDENLSKAASLPASNHYVEGGSTVDISVSVRPDTSVAGTLEVVTGYGATRKQTTVTVDSSPEPDIPIDDTLTEPSTATDRSGLTVDQRRALPFGLVVGFVVIGAVTIAAGSDLAALTVGMIAVLAGIVGAIYLFVQS